MWSRKRFPSRDQASLDLRYPPKGMFMPTKQRCPQCSHPNNRDATRCERCGADFVLTCPQCGRTRPWYVAQCPHCRARATESQLFSDPFQQTSGQGQRIAGRYILEEKLSSGRVSAVYRAVATEGTSNQFYAIKELSPVALFRASERRDAEAALQRALHTWFTIVHPGMTRIFETFAWRDKYYVVFEFVAGQSM